MEKLVSTCSYTLPIQKWIQSLLYENTDELLITIVLLSFQGVTIFTNQSSSLRYRHTMILVSIYNTIYYIFLLIIRACKDITLVWGKIYVQTTTKLMCELAISSSAYKTKLWYNWVYQCLRSVWFHIPPQCHSIKTAPSSACSGTLSCTPWFTLSFLLSHQYAMLSGMWYLGAVGIDNK